jgi:hypothetical protein
MEGTEKVLHMLYLVWSHGLTSVARAECLFKEALIAISDSMTRYKIRLGLSTIGNVSFPQGHVYKQNST